MWLPILIKLEYIHYDLSLCLQLKTPDKTHKNNDQRTLASKSNHADCGVESKLEEATHLRMSVLFFPLFCFVALP